ncbi:MAG: hypothetical protein J0M12_17120 [Deltaproteobacteria bacterium]|nr:hypothetical protein [Deltaproteobacteria bacterium]
MQCKISARPAQLEDLEVLLDLESLRRKSYEVYSPIFWAEAEQAREAQREYFRELLSAKNENAIVRVAEESGRIMAFAIGYIANSPAVYREQKVCFVDDFPIAADASWDTHGRAALEAVESEAIRRGATLTNVVCAQQDLKKRDFLRKRNLAVASEWWVGPIKGDR